MTQARRFDLAAFFLAKFVGGLLMFAVYWALLDAVALDMLEVAVNADNAQRARGATYAKTIWTFLPAVGLTVASVSLISRAVFESRGGAT
ncbi:MAG: hypothetical protein V5A22_07245 [Salinivenus sp.]